MNFPAGLVWVLSGGTRVRLAPTCRLAPAELIRAVPSALAGVPGERGVARGHRTDQALPLAPPRASLIALRVWNAGWRGKRFWRKKTLGRGDLNPINYGAHLTSSSGQGAEKEPQKGAFGDP